MRGADAFFEQVCADDFMQSYHEIGVMLGFADLWAQSTWSKAMPDTRDVEREQVASSLHEGDFIQVKRCPSDVSEWEMAFYAMDGRLFPYSPFHDYDDAALSRWLDELGSDEALLCQVKKSYLLWRRWSGAGPGFLLENLFVFDKGVQNNPVLRFAEQLMALGHPGEFSPAPHLLS